MARFAKWLAVAVLVASALTTPPSHASGTLSASGYRSFKGTSDNLEAASLFINEKIHRHMYYVGNFGYSLALSDTYAQNRQSLFFMTHGIAYEFNDRLRGTIGIGIDQDQYRPEDKIREYVRASVSYTLWK